MNRSKIIDIHIRRRPAGSRFQGIFSFQGRHIPCLLGKGGILARKRERDGATPTGHFNIVYGYYRSVTRIRPRAVIDLNEIKSNQGWCDDPNDGNYNRPVSTPYPRSHEKMLREDRLYNFCFVLDYNLKPRVRNRGSAIFFHLTHPENKPTQGCVAIDPEDMRRILPMLGPWTRVHIHA